MPDIINEKTAYTLTLENGGLTLDRCKVRDNQFNCTEELGDFWAVAYNKSEELRVETRDFDGFVQAFIITALTVDELNYEYKKYLEQDQGVFRIGTWTNRAGEIVIEPVQLVKDTQDALFLATKREQESIYHLKRREYVNIAWLKEELAFNRSLKKEEK